MVVASIVGAARVGVSWGDQPVPEFRALSSEGACLGIAGLDIDPPCYSRWECPSLPKKGAVLTQCGSSGVD